jgi:ribosome-associated toxin RatA of RatAB toxin-antitoxin module
MRTVEYVANLATSPENAYRRLADFTIYPDVADAVMRIDVLAPEHVGDVRRFRSEWEVKLRAGVLRWLEEDEFLDSERTVRFRQIDGDMAMLEGQWSVEESEEGCELRFYAEFDLGLPGLAEFLEPVAERALEENIEELVGRLFVGLVPVGAEADRR